MADIIGAGRPSIGSGQPEPSAMLRQYQQSTNLANVPRLAGATDVSDWDEGAPDPRRCFRGSNRLIDLADDPYNEDITVQIDVFEGDNESIELTSSTSWQAATRPSDDDLSGTSSCVRGGPIATE